MIEQVSFRNFKSLRRADIELGRFMVLVGPNGSGKTSVLDGLHEVARMAVSPEHVRELGGVAPLSLMSRGGGDPMEIHVLGNFQRARAEIGVVLTRDVQPMADTGFVPAWGATVARRWGAFKDEVSIVQGIGDISHGREDFSVSDLSALVSMFDSVRKLRLDIEKLAAASYSEEEAPLLNMDGEGLATVLVDLAGRSPETLQSILEATRRVVPSLERIRSRRARVTRPVQQRIVVDDNPLTHTVDRSYWGQQVVLDFKGAPDIPAPLAGEGTLLVIGLFTTLMTPPRPRLLLLDDIDKGLHPRAQEELVKQLRKVLETDPELQIVATSHSPYLLDCIPPEDVIITGLKPDGSAACAPLTEHPDFERWRDTARTGEFWSFVGEDWVVERAMAEEQAS